MQKKYTLHPAAWESEDHSRLVYPFLDRSLAYRFELAVAHRSIEFALTLPEAQIVPLAGGSLVFGGAGMPVNRVIGLGLEVGGAPVDEAQMDAIESFYRSCGVPARVDLCPLAGRGIVQGLAQRNYGIEMLQNLLYLPLETLPPTPASDVVILPVQPEHTGLWLLTVAQGFSGQDDPPPALLDIIAGTAHSSSVSTYLAWSGDIPAGGGAWVLHRSEAGGVAELCSASTRSAFRRRGVQTALLHSRLQAAKDQGCDFAILLTEPGSASQRNAERVGFRLAYTRAIMKQGRV